MERRRPRRVAELLRHELGRLLADRVNDPRLTGVGVTEVEVSADLKLARIFFVANAGGEEGAAAGLKQASGFLRRELAGRLSLKRIPELDFRFDDSLERGRAMDHLLGSLKEQR